MFYKILKKIEEKDSLPIGSIIEIENDIKFIHLDWGGQIDIQFLIREKYIDIIWEHWFKIGSRVATTNDFNSSRIYYWTILAIHTWREAMVSFNGDDWIDFDYLRAISDNEAKIYF
jgi:hypothetical protein